MPMALRGEIWEVDLDPRKGREQKGVRPCLVVSADGLNRSRFGTIIVCPVTTTRREDFSWRPGLLPEDLRITDVTWRAEPHWVETDQIVTIDRSERLLRQLAMVANRQKMQEVDTWLRRLILPPDTGD
jgi:mRNA interferase MazF